MLKHPAFLTWVTSLALLTCRCLAQTEISQEEIGNLKMMARILNDCTQGEEMSVCFKLKTLNFLNRLLRSVDPVPITEYLTLTRDPNAQVNYTGVAENEAVIEASLPRSLSDKSDRLDDMIWERFKSLVTSRSLRLAVPNDTFEDEEEVETFEGRKKKKILKKVAKKGGGLMMIGTMMMGMMMKMAMGKIALIAGKALIVAKIALVLAVILGIKKLAGGSGGGGSSESPPQVVYAAAEHGGGGGGGWQKRFIDSQNLAYGSHSS